MRVAILCLGSQGDIRPFVALGAALKDRGHSVQILTNSPNESLCKQNGIEYAPLDGDIFAAIEGLGKFELTWKLSQILSAAAKRQFEILNTQLRKVDALIYHPAVFPAEHLVEAIRLPSLCIHLQPNIPTRYMSSVIFPPRLPFRPWSNLASHFIVSQLFWLPIRKVVNQWRTQKTGS